MEICANRYNNFIETMASTNFSLSRNACVLETAFKIDMFLANEWEYVKVHFN